MDVRALAALLFTMIVWGVGPVFFRSLSLALGPGDQLAIRYALAGLMFLPAVLLTGGWRIESRDWPRLLATTLAFVCYNLGSAFGFVRIGAGTGSLIIGTQPLLIALAGILLAGEKPTRATAVGLMVGFAGIVFLVWNDLGITGDPPSFLTGCAMIFGSGASWAVYAVVSKPLSQRYGSFATTALSVVLAALVLIVLLGRPSSLGTLVEMSARSWAEMAYLIVFVTALTMVTWNFGAARLSSAAAGAFLYLVPPIGVAAGVLILGESVTPGMVIGGTLIMAGVAIAQFGSMLKPRAEAV
jgi:drug/metabolite transporter (DMT)-like permease